MTDQTLRYLEEKEALKESFEETGDVARYLACHTRLLESVIDERAKSLSLPLGVALLAAGGFGRAEVFPFSDIDLLVLIPEDLPENDAERVSSFLTSLWDLGLSVGASVRTARETLADCTQDIALSTNFLEARFLYGNKELFEATRAEYLKALNPVTFFREKELEMHQRRRKHDDTPYELEPDIKESPGGLRDIQVLLWCAQAAGLAETPEDLLTSGILNREEWGELTASRAFLSDLRLRLHLMSERAENRLLFEKQIPLALSLGIRATSGLDAAELLMQRYYRNAHNVELLNAIAMCSLEERLLKTDTRPPNAVPVAPGLIARGQTLDIEDPDRIGKDPAFLLTLFFEFSRRQELKDFTTRLMRALYREARKTDTRPFETRTCKEVFRRILQSRYGCTRCLQLMNQWGVLGRLIPAFGRVVGQMQHDLFHAYTVDQHTMRVIKYLRRFTHSSYAHEFPHCSEVMARMESTEELILAAIFHDVGKGLGGHHAALGEGMAGEFCTSLGLSSFSIAFVQFLVREHLTMSATAQKKDTSDPAVVAEFAALVGDKTHLDALYLLTVADIRATNPKVWSTWKAELLKDLYNKTRSVLSGQPLRTDRQSLLAEKEKAVTAALKKSALTDGQIRDYLDKLDLTYFMRHTVEDILWHAAILTQKHGTVDPIIELKEEASGLIKVFLSLRDKPGLLARVFRTFERNGLSVLEARIHTTRSGNVIDTFLVQDKRNRPNLTEFKSLLTEHLRESLENNQELKPLKAARLSRRSRSFPIKPVIDIEPDDAGKGALLQMTCTDRIGLLYTLARVLASHGVNLVSAKITTLDERVEDVFLIEGEALKNPETVLFIETELLRAIESNPQNAASHLKSASLTDHGKY
ncbi:MAG: [protein-PII] uridylyltransferase [Sutterella sp.]|nr:[protein-PII] uridylyltransferase [Sutterella sp.]